MLGVPNYKIVIFVIFLVSLTLGLYNQVGYLNLVVSKPTNGIDDKYLAIVNKIEAHLVTNPDDATGWQVIAPTYLSLNEAEKAFQAYANAIKYGNSNGSNWLGLGKADLLINKGEFGPMSKVAFKKAHEKSPDDIESMLYYASMLQNTGSTQMAKTLLTDFIRTHDFNDVELAPLNQLLKIFNKDNPEK